jgi:hypothetical protein
MKRRLFGTIKRLPSRRYRACYKPDGRRVHAQETFATKVEASAWLANTETDLRRGIRVERGQETFYWWGIRALAFVEPVPPPSWSTKPVVNAGTHLRRLQRPAKAVGGRWPH